MCNPIGSLPIVIVLLFGLPTISGQTRAALPAGFQQVTSTHGTFEYVVPSEWIKDGFNSYKGSDGRAIEQVYPAAVITEEYCRSGLSSAGESETSVYENGNVRGCYVSRRVVNARLNTRWRHISFRFPTPNGVEDLTIIMPEERFDEARAKTIVNSIRPK